MTFVVDPSHPALRFIERSNQRHIPSDYVGDVYIWDIDKTYLDTHFSSVRGLLRIPFEFAVDKQSVPGTVPLLRALRRGIGPRSQLVPLYFVSGSPPQLRSVVERKMTLDGVEFDGITFKDQWGFVRAGRPKGVKEQIGYKLRALLLYRHEIPGGARFTLFGDDVESDTDVFQLFGEVCAGFRGRDLERTLQQKGVHHDDVRAIRELSDPLPTTANPVEHIFIHLSRGSDPHSLVGERVYPTHSFFQASLVLAYVEKVAVSAVFSVLDDVRRSGRVPDAVLRRQVEDAESRLGVSRSFIEGLGLAWD